ncbi:Nuclear pore complex protein Nup214, partial [Stegodyphus mimosarum]
MGVMYCAQRKIIISENESYPPMPIIFFLTDNGLLVSFHMINSAPDCVSLVRPSTPIEIEGERKRPDHIQSKTDETTAVRTATEAANTTVASPVLVSSAFLPPVQENKTSRLSFDFNKNSTFGFSQSNSGLSQDFSAHQNNKEGSLAFGSNLQQPNLNMVSPFRNTVLPPQSIATSSSFLGGSSQSAAISGSFFGSTSQPVYINTSSPDTEKIHKLSRGTPLNLVTSTPNKETTAGIRPVAVAQRSASGNKLAHDGDVPRINAVTNLKQSAFEPPLPSGSPGKILESGTITKFDTQMTYMSAIAEEINNFEKDIKDLQQSANFLICIGTKEEMTSLKSFTLNLQDFLKDMSDTMQSLNSDFHSLKNVLLESFVMVEEANSRERRKNDHSYISMLKDRALDPMTAKRMQKINQLYQYLHNQLREVNDKMDRDWVEFLEKKKNKKAVRQVSSTEAIYKTIVNNQKIIHNLRNNVDYISKKVAEKKMENISKRRNRVTYNKRLERGELSQLADAFLKAQISTEDESKTIAKKFSPKQQNLLKEFLSNSSITVVRP